MVDITYADLVKARSNDNDGGDNLLTMANVALKILEQVNALKGGGGNVMASRPVEAQTQSQQPKSITTADISEALAMVKQLKGDIKISELEKLLKEHGDQINGLLKGKT
jgi:hypothetical protein